MSHTGCGCWERCGLSWQWGDGGPSSRRGSGARYHGNGEVGVECGWDPSRARGRGHNDALGHLATDGVGRVGHHGAFGWDVGVRLAPGGRYSMFVKLLNIETEH